MVMSKSIMSSIVTFFRKKRNLLIIGIILIIVLSSTSVFLLLSNDDEHIITGTLFIDSSPAPMGVDVKIIFPDGEASDPDGTDELGRYRIDVSDFQNGTGTFYVTYNGTTYIPMNRTGSYFDFSIENGFNAPSLDLYVFTTSDNTDDDNNQYHPRKC